jgi:hypothetical protein
LRTIAGLATKSNKPLRARLSGAFKWLRGLDLNQGPSGYEPDELPGCSTPRSIAGRNMPPPSLSASSFFRRISFSASNVTSDVGVTETSRRDPLPSHALPHHETNSRSPSPRGETRGHAGIDCIMPSTESSTGRYPDEAARMSWPRSPESPRRASPKPGSMTSACSAPNSVRTLRFAGPSPSPAPPNPSRSARGTENWRDFAAAYSSEHDVSGSIAMLVAGPSDRHPEANRRIGFMRVACAQ